jgi:hypothetical protein
MPKIKDCIFALVSKNNTFQVSNSEISNACLSRHVLLLSPVFFPSYGSKSTLCFWNTQGIIRIFVQALANR